MSESEQEQNREREGPGSGNEEKLPDVPGERVSPEKKPDESEKADRDSEESFPASDPPANY